jgi:hypothetical protein
MSRWLGSIEEVVSNADLIVFETLSQDDMDNFWESYVGNLNR